MALPSAALEALIAGDSIAASAIVGVALPVDLGRQAQALLILRLADLRTAPADAAWLLRVVALRVAGRPMVGLTGFHGRPDPSGTAEVGYEILPERRGQGYAQEATAALTNWALTDGRARCVIAAIRPDNEASLGVVRRLGFVSAGSRWDSVDGTALLFERRTPVVATGAKMRKTDGRVRPEERPMTDNEAMPAGTAPTQHHVLRVRLREIFRAHRSDPDDPDHRCLCGYDGESYDDHMADTTVATMEQLGLAVYPTRHSA